jgi:hypothetical protein
VVAKVKRPPDICNAVALKKHIIFCSTFKTLFNELYSFNCVYSFTLATYKHGKGIEYEHYKKLAPTA